MDWLHLTVKLLFLLLFASIVLWTGIYRRLNPGNLRSSRYYRWHQWLLAMIAVLAILIAIIVVFSSDPGDIEDHFLWP